MKKQTAPVVRTLEAADDSYAAAKALRTRLRAATAKIDAEESDLLTRLANRPATPEKTGRVAALLGDALPDDEEAPDGVRARLKQIASERVDLCSAIDIAAQRLATTRFSASKTICAEVESAYTERVKALAAALLAAHQARVELHELIDALNANDIAWTGHLPPMHADRPMNRIGSWLRDAADAGFIKKSEIPTGLLQ